MSNLPESATFDAGVYELETTDLVLGGPSGPANAAAQNLTNRTRWLYDEVNSLAADVTFIGSEIATINGQISTINGQISGINANLASINGQLPLLAPIANPSFTGTPTAPTPGSFVNNAQLATTSYCFTWFAPKASPAFTGVHTAPTAAAGTNTTQLATCAFVLQTNSISGNGYRKNADGTIDQWGFANPAGGGITVTFPTTFPNACFSVQGISVAGGAVQTWLGANPGTSSFNLHNSGGTAFWRAIGN